MAEPPVARLTKAALSKELGTYGPLWAGRPVEVRQVLRKLGVDNILVTPDGDGWKFKGLADLGRLVEGHKGERDPPPSRPQNPIAPAEPALELSHPASIPSPKSC